MARVEDPLLSCGLKWSRGQQYRQKESAGSGAGDNNSESAVGFPTIVKHVRLSWQATRNGST